MSRSRKLPAVVLAVVLVGLILSGIGPEDRFTWWLEVAPILVALPILAGTYRRFPLTSLAYVLIGVQACILMLGAHYTYAEVPLGFWVRDALGLERNHYDRLGHIAQGFVPAIIIREVLMRTSSLRPGRWLSFLVVCVALAVSAVYEFLEWWAAVLTGESATAFLGTQGDPWDTQWDMFLCTVGAVLSLILLSRLHDRQVARVEALRDTTRP